MGSSAEHLNQPFNNIQYIRKNQGEIPSISNEIELNVVGVAAQEVIARSDLELDPEVNKQDVIELLNSMQPNVGQLNANIPALLYNLHETVAELGGALYAGSSVLKDTSKREPARYRTTSLSETLAHSLLDMTSMQIVMGIDKHHRGAETFAVDVYNFLRQLSPVTIAMSASSPYRVSGNTLIDTGLQSRRMNQYEAGTRYLPSDILLAPHLSSLDEYDLELESISDQVNSYLDADELDANWEELCEEREDGAYFPFNLLAPHQIYWMVRPRLDHANQDSLLSIEYRVADAPLTVSGMQTMNSFVMGLVYYGARNGFEAVDEVLPDYTDLHDKQYMFQIVKRAAQDGLETKVGRNNRSLADTVRQLLKLSRQGLIFRGEDADLMVGGVNAILENDNDAHRIRTLVSASDATTPEELEQKLALILYNSLLSDRRTL